MLKKFAAFLGIASSGLLAASGVGDAQSGATDAARPTLLETLKGLLEREAVGGCSEFGPVLDLAWTEKPSQHGKLFVAVGGAPWVRSIECTEWPKAGLRSQDKLTMEIASLSYSSNIR